VILQVTGVIRADPSVQSPACALRNACIMGIKIICAGGTTTDPAIPWYFFRR